jgi:hypothetical protein
MGYYFGLHSADSFSAAARIGLRKDPLLSALPSPRPAGTSDWLAWLAKKDDERRPEHLLAESLTSQG